VAVQLINGGCTRDALENTSGTPIEGIQEKLKVCDTRKGVHVLTKELNAAYIFPPH
jgi:hypothetical protein